MSNQAFEKTLALCVPAFIVLLVLTAGCNGKSTTTEVQPGTDQAAVDLLSSSAAKMAGVTSYQAESSTKITTNVEIEEIMPSQATIEFEYTNGAWNKKMMTDSALEGMQEIYIIGNRMYVKVADKWYYKDSDPITEAKRSMVDLSTPESIQLAVENADEVGLVTESDSSATCRLQLGAKYYQAVGRELEKTARDLGLTGSEQQIAELKDSWKSMSMRVDITIDKSTGLFSGMSISMQTGDITSPEGQTMRMTAEVETKLGEYGKTFDIQLPEEAKNAEYMPAK